MEEDQLNTSVQDIRIFFKDQRFSEDRVIEYVSDEFLKFISRRQALEICELIKEGFNETLDLIEHMFNACYDYFKNQKFQSKS